MSEIIAGANVLPPLDHVEIDALCDLIESGCLPLDYLSSLGHRLQKARQIMPDGQSDLARDNFHATSDYLSEGDRIRAGLHGEAMRLRTSAKRLHLLLKLLPSDQADELAARCAGLAYDVEALVKEKIALDVGGGESTLET